MLFLIHGMMCKYQHVVDLHVCFTVVNFYYFLMHRCQEKSYPNVFINASVIICFYNEDPSTLFRTVHSVLYRTPSNLLHEVIVVNDNSDHGKVIYLFDNITFNTLVLLEDLVDLQKKFSLQNFPVQVQLVKTRRREGLIRARIFGAKKASGNVSFL